MKTAEKIDALKHQLQEIDELRRESGGPSDSKHVRWREATKRRIKSIFGEKSEHFKKFDSIHYVSHLIAGSNSEQRRIDMNAYSRGLESAENRLLVMIDELTEIETSEENSLQVSMDNEDLDSQSFPELQPFMESFRKDHPSSEKCAFIMMQFTNTRLHNEIIMTIKSSCASHGIVALRADDKSYSDDLLPNVRTYMHSCGFGIAIFERLTSEIFNPNVSLEVGYMMALGKPTLLLKDSTLSSLPTDLVGRLYKTFDTQNPQESMPPVIEKWLGEKSLV